MGLGPTGAIALIVIIMAVITGFLVLFALYQTAKDEKKVLLESFHGVFVQMSLAQLKNIAIPYLHCDNTGVRDEITELYYKVLKEKKDAEIK